MMDISPVISPNFREPKPSDSEDSDSDTHSSESPESETDSEPSPRRPTQIGPVLPPGFKLDVNKHDDDEHGKMETNSYGPALPPVPEIKTRYGPVLPPGLNLSKSEEADDDTDMIGPKVNISSQLDSGHSAAAEFEIRSQRMKNKLENTEEEGPAKRETWMLELPEKMRIGVGLEARKFKTSRSTADGDGSVWVETPADRAKREQDAREGKIRKRPHEDDPILSERDKQIEEHVELLNSKRQKSLYEMHQEEIYGKKEKKNKKGKDKDKKKKKERKSKEKKKKDKDKKKKVKTDKPGRRPFDRDQDLKVNRFDDAMRKHYIKKAQGLGSNFAHSSGQKYL